MASLTDPRRDLRLSSRHQSGVATEDSTLNISFSLNHIPLSQPLSLVALVILVTSSTSSHDFAC